MYNTCVTSTISLGRKSAHLSSFNDCTHCSRERHPFADSSSRASCSCCFNTMYEVRRVPRCFCSLFGVRQSSLIEWSHSRRLVSSGLNWCSYYVRLPVCDVHGSSTCGTVCRFGEKGVGWRGVGVRQRGVYEGMCRGYDYRGVGEAEDVREECFGLRKVTRRLAKKSLLEKGGDCEFGKRCGSKKKAIVLGVLESERMRRHGLVVSSEKGNGRTEEALVWEMHEDSLWTNRTARGKEERKALLGRDRKEEGRKGSESKLRKQHWKVSSKIEEVEDVLRRDEHDLKARRKGLTGSSYCSYLNDDSNSKSGAERNGGGFLEDFSRGGREGNSRSNKIILPEGKEEDWNCKDYKEDCGVVLTKKITREEFCAGFVDCAFRKESEKKLVDLLVEDTKLIKEASEKGSKLAMTHESKSEESSYRHMSYNGRQGQSSMKFVDEGKQQHRQTRSARQSETKMKYKQFLGMQDPHNDDVINSDNSKKLISEKSEMSSVAASSNQKTVGEHRTTVGVSKMEDEYQRNSNKVARISEIQEIDIKKTSSSQHGFVANFKEQQDSDRVSGLIQSSGESQILTKKEGKSILKGISNIIVKQEENFNLVAGSSLESIELTSQTHANILKEDNPRQGSDELTKISFIHSQDSGTIDLKGRNKTKSEFVHEEQQQNPVQYSSVDFQPTKHEPRNDDQQLGTTGPSEEILKVDDPFFHVNSIKLVKNEANTAGKAIVKGSRRSLWGVVLDFVQLRWFSRSESRSSGREIGRRNLPNHPTSSETWFSGNGDKNEEAAGGKEQKSIAQGLSSSQPEVKSGSPVEGSSLSTLEGHLKDVRINIPSSSKVIDSGSSEKTESAADEREPKQKKLNQKDHFVEDRFDEWENVYRLEVEQRRTDEAFMREALLESQKAADNWEVPVGAVLVHDGKIIARGCNLVEEMRDSTAHAEMICIREASNVLQTQRLSETTLYVTLEPCPMCAGAIIQARIDTVVWGAPNKLLGADGSWIRLFPNGDEGNGLDQTDKPAAPVHPFHPNIFIRQAVLASECADAMQQFFKLRKPDHSMSPPSCLPIPHSPPKFLEKILDALHLMFCL